MSSIMTSRQAAELDYALERNQWTATNVKKASEGDILARFLDVLLGRAEINYLIDLDADPYVPEHWSVIEHKKGGKVRWDPKKISLYLSPKQRDGKVVKGGELRKELAHLPVLNANALDFLLRYSHLNFIPKKWKGKRIYFWGTIYCSDFNGGLGVRALCQAGDDCWTDGCIPLSYDFDCNHPAILLAG